MGNRRMKGWKTFVAGCWLAGVLSLVADAAVPCQMNEDCDDGMGCTFDACVGGVCQNTIMPVGLACRASAGPCDPREFCDGLTPACPPDAFVPDGTTCTNDGFVCTDDVCIAGLCRHPFKPAGTVVCRPSAGGCDPPERCDGLTVGCPPDALEPAGTICRAGHPTLYDPVEVCDGVTAACPPDALKPAGTLCRAARGPCNPAEFCNGLRACLRSPFMPGRGVGSSGWSWRGRSSTHSFRRVLRSLCSAVDTVRATPAFAPPPNAWAIL